MGLLVVTVLYSVSLGERAGKGKEIQLRENQELTGVLDTTQI